MRPAIRPKAHLGFARFYLTFTPGISAQRFVGILFIPDIALGLNSV